MNESQLTDLLERAGDQTTVGPAPIDAMRAGAKRRRRRRTVGISLAAAVGVLVAGGGTALLIAPGTDPGKKQVPAATKAPTPVLTATKGVPAGMRLVGSGHLAIAVPQEFGTNQARCGTPQSDTVLIDAWLVQLCAVARPSGVESVEVGSGVPGPQYRYNFHADETFEIDGIQAQRQRTSCAPGSLHGPEVCAGTVFLPSAGVWFRAESSTSADEVDRLLRGIMVVPDLVGVPTFHGAISREEGNSGRMYADLLRSLGLRVQTKTVPAPAFTPGELLKVSPFPGTMLEPGVTVTITVVAKR